MFYNYYYEDFNNKWTVSNTLPCMLCNAPLLPCANEREEQARQLIAEGKVKLVNSRLLRQSIHLIAGIVEEGMVCLQITLRLTADRCIEKAFCPCAFFKENNLRQGPCVHILAVRMAQRKLVD